MSRWEVGRLVFSFQFSVFSKEGEGWPARPTDFGRGSGTGGSRISRGKRKSSLRRKKGKRAGPAVQPYRGLVTKHRLTEAGGCRMHPPIGRGFNRSKGTKDGGDDESGSHG